MFEATQNNATITSPKTVHATSLNQRWILADSAEQLESFMAKKGLKKVECVEITARGTDAAQSSMHRQYEDRWKDMQKFFLMIGDYQSALLVSRDICPDAPLPIKPASLCAYASFCFNDVGTTVRHYTTDVPILDRRGNHIMALGVWQSPNNVNKLQACVMALHELYEHLRPVYSQPCSECNRLTTQFKSSQAYTPCPDHTIGAHVVERGNPMLDKHVKEHFSKLRADLTRTFQEKGTNEQLTPDEVRRLRNILLIDMGNPNRRVALEGLKFYTMVILGVKLFLRAEELATIRMEDFIESLQIMTPERGVRALVIQVCGKGGMKNVPLILFTDEEFPEFCPVRHLLLWVHLSGVKSGYLFPAEWTRCDANNDECYNYKRFLAKLKFLCVEKLGRRSESSIYGTDFLRNTGYLFAIWGILKVQPSSLKDCDEIPNLYMGALMNDARHKIISNTKTSYARDSVVLYEWTRTAQEGTSELFTDSFPKYRAIAILDRGPFEACAGASRAFQGSLDKVSHWWFSTVCGLTQREGDRLSHYITPCFASQGITSGHSYLENILKLHMPPSVLAGALQALRSIPQGAAASTLGALPPTTTTGTSGNVGVHAAPHGNVGVSHHSTQGPTTTRKRQRVYGENDLIARRLMKGATEDEKKETLFRIYMENKTLSSEEMTSAARKVWYSVIKPIGKCMEICFQGQPSTFPHKIKTGKTYKCECRGALM